MMKDKSNSVISSDQDDSFEEVFEIIKKVGITAHKYGSTSTRLEAFLNELASRFGYRGVFRSNPSEIIFAVNQGSGHAQKVEIVATSLPGVDLDKLARLGDVINEMGTGNLSLSETAEKIDSIDKVPAPWGKFATMLGYAFTGLGLTPLLGGGWYDTIFATFFSILVYGIVMLSGRMGKVATDWLPLTSAFVVGLAATSAKAWIPEVNVLLVMVSAIAILLPGYTISLGAGELIGQRVVSGTANLMNGLVCLIKQLIGGWLGVVLASSFHIGIANSPSTPVGQVWMLGLFPLLLVGLGFAFQVSKRDFVWSMMISAISFAAVIAGSNLLDSNLGNLLGSVVAVVISNFWARKTGRPTSIVLIPAIVMLVSGTIGFRGLATMASGDLTLGFQQFMSMFLVAITIFAGILIGFTLVRPEKTL